MRLLGEVIPSPFHSKSDLQNTVRIIRPHHPLFGKTVNLVKIWEHKRRRNKCAPNSSKRVGRTEERLGPATERLCNQITTVVPIH